MTQKAQYKKFCELQTIMRREWRKHLKAKLPYPFWESRTCRKLALRWHYIKHPEIKAKDEATAAQFS